MPQEQYSHKTDPGYVFLNGRLIPAAKACVPVLDRGFAYGDSLVETLKLTAGWPVFFEEHVARLRQGMESAGMEEAIDPLVLSNEIIVLAKANSAANGRLRIQLTRGTPLQPQGLDPEPGLTPTLLLTAEPFAGYPPELYRDGIKCATVALNRGQLASLKTTNLMATIVARRQAAARGAAEAIFTSGHGRLLEGSMSNIFFIQGDTLLTAPETDPVLPGVVRGKVLELAARSGIQVELRAPKPEELNPVSTSAFLTSSVLGVCPVSEIDTVPLRTHVLMTGQMAEGLEQLERLSLSR